MALSATITPIVASAGTAAAAVATGSVDAVSGVAAVTSEVAWLFAAPGNWEGQKDQGVPFFASGLGSNPWVKARPRLQHCALNNNHTRQ